MTNQEILQKAINKALDNGWSTAPLFSWIPVDRQALLAFWLGNSDAYKGVIFNHDFAKALWSDPEGYNKEVPSWGDPVPYWRHRLGEMVQADDPIKYLGEHLDD